MPKQFWFILGTIAVMSFIEFRDWTIKKELKKIWKELGKENEFLI